MSGVLKQAGQGVGDHRRGYGVASVVFDDVRAALGEELDFGIGQAADLLVKRRVGAPFVWAKRTKN